MNLSKMKRYAIQYGIGDISKILCEAVVLHEDWEMDNRAWLVLMMDGKRQLLGTNHGGLYKLNMEELEEFLKAVEDSAASIRNLIEEAK